MKDQWYADNRDLVKWSVLHHLALKEGAGTILQIAYYRPTEWSGVVIDGQLKPLPEPIIAHFRDVRSAASISGRYNIRVLFDELCDHAEYLNLVFANIQELPAEPPCIVFLDPDTGLEPQGRTTLKHVREADLRAIWNALHPGHTLVFYQHQTNMAGRPWIEEKQRQFERACGLAEGAAKLACGPEIAGDVVFFFAKKAMGPTGSRDFGGRPSERI